ncbi:hypothetical protein ACTMTF_48875 [Nonomuraea sp. ZG12]|uniref:hypothetical protein n=1 Tax=Nonomuraea sp. ZG12 TaxID=3452207 RepID=UPI003F8C6459
MIGHVTEERYAALVAGARELVATMSRCQFALGDHALEIEPMQSQGGAHGPIGRACAPHCSHYALAISRIYVTE